MAVGYIISNTAKGAYKGTEYVKIVIVKLNHKA